MQTAAFMSAHQWPPTVFAFSLSGTPAPAGAALPAGAVCRRAVARPPPPSCASPSARRAPPFEAPATPRPMLSGCKAKTTQSRNKSSSLPFVHAPSRPESMLSHRTCAPTCRTRCSSWGSPGRLKSAAVAFVPRLSAGASSSRSAASTSSLTPVLAISACSAIIRHHSVLRRRHFVVC